MHLPRLYLYLIVNQSSSPAHKIETKPYQASKWYFKGLYEYWSLKKFTYFFMNDDIVKFQDYLSWNP